MKQINFNCLCNVIILFLLTLLSYSTTAQTFREIIDDDSTETSEDRFELLKEFMSDIDFENAVDIGSGNMKLVLKIANEFPTKSFVLEEIDSKYCNWKMMLFQIRIEKLGQIDTNNLSIHIGGLKSTGLPSNQFDLILISGTLHEVEFKSELFQDLQRILKSDGTLIIFDSFYKIPPDLHQGCSNRFMTHSEMEEFMRDEGLNVIKDWRLIGISTKSNGPYTSRIIQCHFN